MIICFELKKNLMKNDVGGGALGHPLEYIRLDTVHAGDIATCVYCGLRYKAKSHDH